MLGCVHTISDVAPYVALLGGREVVFACTTTQRAASIPSAPNSVTRACVCVLWWHDWGP
jgi:hypothetical protein